MSGRARRLWECLGPGILLAATSIGASHLVMSPQAGALFDHRGTSTQGRVGVGYRFMFFMVGVMPYIYVQTTDQGRFSWSIGVRLQY